MATNPFGDIESHIISRNTEPNTLNVYLLLDSATTDTILCDKKYFSYLGHVNRKHITTITSSHLISYQIGKACIVMPGGTCIRVSRTDIYKEFIEFPRHSTQRFSSSYNQRKQLRVVADLGST